MNYKPSLWLLALTTALISCQKEPDWPEQSNEYLVYTQKDASFEAGRYEFCSSTMRKNPNILREQKRKKSSQG